MLEINNLHVTVDGKSILKGLNLNLGAGEVHAIMGPNGSGKSTLSFVLAGRDGYEVTQGSIRYQGQDLLAMNTEQRAQAGIFLAMQYPVELPGVNNMVFLRESINTLRRARVEKELDAVTFLNLVKEKARDIELDDKLLKRSVNAGFSGGEKKRNEILQMTLLQPTLAILDETDSGLDIDAIRTVADGVNRLRSAERSFLLVTHYQRLLNYIQPDYVHVLADGKIICSGGKELAEQLEQKGYGWITEGAAA